MATPQEPSAAELAHQRQDLRQVRWMLRLSPAQRVEVNRKAYRLWVVGQRNRARKLAERRSALTDAS
jgi:hypothetical protein